MLRAAVRARNGARAAGLVPPSFRAGSAGAARALASTAATAPLPPQPLQGLDVAAREPLTVSPNAALLARCGAKGARVEVGATREAFVVEHSERLEDFGVTAVLLRHETTGLAVALLDAPADSHSFFSIAFRTGAPDDTGVPHILEHTVLCGSERFDVKDPFHAMTRRSLATDANASTGADSTA
jgi:Zn-dependent M16 (insulinase) family peptidase